MRCASKFAWVTLIALAWGSPAEAGWHSFWSRVHLDFHRMNCWPQPFNAVDRDATRAPLETMVANGWQRQNTLSHYYFHQETQRLTEAGELKLHSILTSSPPQHRAVFVVRANSAEATEVRLDSVQQAVVRLMPEQSLPMVLPTSIEPRSWPAEYIDAIERKLHGSFPDPRLPQADAPTGG